jgi:hypothetical protein
MKSLNKYLILSLFIFSIPTIGIALPKCGNTLHNCTGEYTWKSGNKYVGDWKNNKMHGLGTFYFKKSGDEYDGDWKNNKKHGFGTFYWNNGDKYVGNYLNNNRHGKGRYTYKSGNKYDGDWVNGKRTGEGVFTFANGQKQEGVFKDSKFLYAKKLKTNTIEKRLKAKGKELVNKANKVKSKNNSKTTGYSKWKWGESPLCRAVIRAAKTGDKVDWKLNVDSAKNHIQQYPKSDVKDCFEEAKKIYASRDFTPKPKFIVVDSREYNSKKSIGWNRVYDNPQYNEKYKITRPAMKFIATNEKIYTGLNFKTGNAFISPFFRPTYNLEEVSNCRYKVRYNLKDHSKNFGKVEKVIIDFNKVNFKTLDYHYETHIQGFKYRCNGICHSVYGKVFFDNLPPPKKIYWQKFNTLTIYTIKEDNMVSRLSSALSDIKRVCNKSTSKY